ncbi:hypothetical protein OIO90_003022 [Microbotryomycetes sp. JL221]|nr:hypothetical protein OIO90_003022 [Microbotryomycetes sp. JL221]
MTDGLYCTVGCHPCRAQEFDQHPQGPQEYLKQLENLIAQTLTQPNNPIVAIGECGLDGDRTFLCPMETQLKHFPKQLELATKFDLPLFLHSRAAHRDFVDILKNHDKSLRGVVHSHSESYEQALECIELGFYIGINGCSLKTEENLDCVRRLPLDKLMVESDCPWCEIRPSHASHTFLKTLSTSEQYKHLTGLYTPEMKKKERFQEGLGIKGRNEPCSTGAVAWVVAQLHGVSLEQVAQQTYQNTCDLFRLRND